MVVNELKGRTVYFLLLVSLVVLFLAYQVRTPLEVDVGATGDEAYLSGFHDPESAGDISYRWSSDSSFVRLPGIAARAPTMLRLRLNGSRPIGVDAPRVTVLANGHDLCSFSASQDFESYEVPVNGQILGLSGDLEIEVRADSFVPAERAGGSDLRRLGVMVDYVALDLQPLSASPVLPPVPQLLFLSASVTACYLWTRQMTLPRNISLVVAGALLLVLATLVVRGRLWLGLYYLWIFMLLVCANAATILARPALAALRGKRGLSSPDLKDLHLLLGGAVVVASGLYVRSAIWQPLREDQATDFFINYAAATVLAEGGDIYDADSLREASRDWNKPTVAFDFGSLFATYITPPTYAILLLPLVPLGYDRARILFLLLSNVFLFSFLALTLRGSGGAALRPPRLLLSLLLLLAFPPVYTSLQLGQVDCVILFLLSVSYWAYKSDRNILVGPCLAIAAVIKLSPAILILYFLWKREYVIFASASAIAILAGGLSLLLSGREALLTFATTILPALLKGTAFFHNQGLNGFFSRLFVPPGLYYSLQEFPSVSQARALSLLGSLILLCVGAYLTRHRVARGTIRFDLEFSLALATALLVSSVSWHHYLTWLLLVFVVLLNPALHKTAASHRYLAATLCAGAGYVIMAIPLELYGMTLHASADTLSAPLGSVLLLSLGVYGALLLYSSLAIFLAGRLPAQDSQVGAQSQAQAARVSS
jgi:hypothetical protein